MVLETNGLAAMILKTLGGVQLNEITVLMRQMRLPEGQNIENTVAD
jgi:hypothetical protein